MILFTIVITDTCVQHKTPQPKKTQTKIYTRAYLHLSAYYEFYIPLDFRQARIFSKKHPRLAYHIAVTNAAPIATY